MAARENRYLRDIPLPGMEERPSGYRGPVVCQIVGISYRQLDYWTTTGLITPSVRSAEGSGSQRLYAFEDIVQLRVIKSLLDAGVSLQRIRAAIDYVRERGLSLRGLTLVSDGTTVYALDDSRDVVDLLAKGQGVFGIAVEPVWHAVEADITRMPAETTSGGVISGGLDTAPGSPGEDAAGRAAPS